LGHGKFSVAGKQLAEALGLPPPAGGGGSPEVPPEMLKRDFELLIGSTGGHRISKYGVTYGLIPMLQALGEAVKSQPIKTYAPLLSRLVAGTVSLTILGFVAHKWARIFAFGGLFENVEAGLDYLESLVLVRK